MKQILELLQGLNLFSAFVRLLLATLCGGVIGLEREKRGRPAGLRTHILVCIGSTMAMIVGLYLNLRFGAENDIGRIGAQVISGIGFLGVGMIIVTSKQQVKGLTTAAGLWASACMGLAIGVGYYGASLIACAFIWFVIQVLHHLDEQVLNSDDTARLWVQVETTQDAMHLMDFLYRQKLAVTQIQMDPSRENTANSYGILAFSVALKHDEQKAQLLLSIADEPGVVSVREIS